MKYRPHAVISIFLLIIFPPFSAYCEAFRGHFDFYWGGIPVGKIVLSYKEDDSRYRVDSYARTRGLVKLISTHKSTVFAEGEKMQEGYKPSHFRSEYEDGNKEKLIEITYNAQGGVDKETIRPVKRESRPDVPAEMKKGSYDILSAVLGMRERVIHYKKCIDSSADAVCSPVITVPVFDGKRRYDLRAEIEPELSEFYSAGYDQQAYRLKLERIPLAGFRQKELRKMAETKDQPVYFYVHPDTVVPLGLEVDVKGVPLVGRLEAPAGSSLVVER